jgi:hypothetical protein
MYLLRRALRDISKEANLAIPILVRRFEPRENICFKSSLLLKPRKTFSHFFYEEAFLNETGLN